MNVACRPSLQAREAVEARAQIQQKLAQKQKESKEEQMRLLAQQAREVRAGIKVETANTGGLSCWWSKQSLVE